MGKTKHRKGHKDKVRAHKSKVQQKRYSFNKLVDELDKQMKIIQSNPITGVDIQPQEHLTITGQLPAHEIKL